MKITDIKVRILKPSEHQFTWGEHMPPRQVPHNVVTVQTDI